MKLLYLVLSVALILCLLPMPYGYYVFVRYISMIAFGAIAYKLYNEQKKQLAFSFLVLAVLFQPFFKFALGRVMWNIVDVVVALFLVFLLWKDFKKTI